LRKLTGFGKRYGISTNPLSEDIFLKTNWLATLCATALFVTGASMASAQGHTQFDDKDRKTTTDWYNQHKDHPPVGFRDQDRLSTDQESRLHEGATLDNDMRKKVHPVPEDLRRNLPPPPSDHRYVAIGGHVGLIDNKFQVKAVIHLH
jgi:Ni/Co efflux regulator RcnB